MFCFTESGRSCPNWYVHRLRRILATGDFTLGEPLTRFEESFAKLNEDGSLEVPYEKFYGIEHIAIAVLKKIKPGKKVYEKEVVYAINLFQIIFIVLGLLTLL